MSTAEAMASGGSHARTAGSRRQRHEIGKEMQMLLYAFGEVGYPLQDTKDLLEDMVVEYINDLCLEALRIARPRGKIRLDDYLGALRKDTKKFARAHQMLVSSKQIKSARQVAEMDDGRGAAKLRDFDE